MIKFERDNKITYFKDAEAALEWLMLIPPDKFDGNWQKVYDELESALYWGNDNAVR